MKKLLAILGCALFLSCTFTTANAEVKYITERSKDKIWVFAYELYMPKGKYAENPKGVIISQHGSTRDGMFFSDKEARTDKYSTLVVKEGTKQGFAVVVIDAFYKTGLSPLDKRRFPGAWDFAFRVKKDLQGQFDKFFYTGWSYGASSVLNTIDARRKDKGNWDGAVASNPACGIVSMPIKVNYPVLIIKGENDHYPLRACEWYQRELRDSGTAVELDVIKGANHFFGTGGEVVHNSRAMNGCADDPVIRMPDDTYWLAISGKQITRQDIGKLCSTNKSQKTKNTKHLKDVVIKTVAFFDREVYSSK